MKPTLALLLVFCLSAAAIGQAPPESTGPFAGYPSAQSLAPDSFAGTVPLDRSAPYFKEPGFSTLQPFTWADNGATPDFRIASIMVGAKAPYPDIDGMSIGVDWIVSDVMGRYSRPQGDWAAFNFSVTPATKGAIGTLLELEAINTGGAASDLLTYVLPRSRMQPQWVDEVTRAHNDNEIAVRSGVLGKPSNVDAHDVFMSAYQLSPAIVSLMPREPRFYFSVSTATLGRVPTSWWGGTKPSGATILFSQWSRTTRTWSRPAVFLSYDRLGLAQSEDLDALAVDEGNARILFSTKTSTRDPLLIALPVSGVLKVFIYRLLDGTPISSRLGFASGDDVDAICALDPGGRQQRNFLPFIMGQPQNQRLLRGFSSRTTATAWRAFYRVRGDHIKAILVGWPRSGRPANGAAILAVSFPSQPTLPLQIVQTVQRNTRARFPGDPICVARQVPNLPGLRGLPVLVHWVAGNRGGFLSNPFPVQIRL